MLENQMVHKQLEQPFWTIDRVNRHNFGSDHYLDQIKISF